MRALMAVLAAQLMACWLASQATSRKTLRRYWLQRRFDCNLQRDALHTRLAAATPQTQQHAGVRASMPAFKSSLSSSQSLRLASGNRHVVRPDRLAASTFSFTPPMGSTRPARSAQGASCSRQLWQTIKVSRRCW
jgi:hypothetical protein